MLFDATGRTLRKGQLIQTACIIMAGLLCDVTFGPQQQRLILLLLSEVKDRLTVEILVDNPDHKKVGATHVHFGKVGFDSALMFSNSISI